MLPLAWAPACRVVETTFMPTVRPQAQSDKKLIKDLPRMDL
jgi:hypothetical protein